VVTGHHARLEGGVLRRSVDPAKDQSYVLAVLRTDQLAHAMFPLGSSTKEEVRAEAARRGLAVADKPDSHDICFIADGDTRGFLRRALGDRPGPVVDAVTGAELGRHDGAYGFTVGQRRGLGLDRPGGPPRYVLSIEPVRGTVTVGPGSMLDVGAVTGSRPVWTSGSAPAASFECLAQLRAHGAAVPAVVTVADALHVRLLEPVRGIATGQAVVLYDGDTVLGAATVAATAGVELAEA
jgi:tRNA-specific 2-thiouridylase